MRSPTKTLSLGAAAALLMHCASPTAEDVSADQNAASTVAQDDRDGLTPINGDTARARTREADVVADAIAYATETATEAGADAPTFSVLKVSRDIDGLDHVRLQQMHDGVPVWGADSVVHVSEQAVVGMAGSIARNLAMTDAAVTLDGKAALARAKADRFGNRVVETTRESAERIIHVDRSGTARLAVHTSFFNELEADFAPARWNHIYDAQTGELLARWNELHTLSQASGVGGNPKYVHSWNDALDVEPQGSGYVLTTARLRTLNANEGSGSGTEVTGPLQAIGDAPINDAHGFAEVTLNVLKEWFTRESIDDRGYRIVSRVHYGRRFENAFWDGQRMTYGDGADTFYPLSGSVDVVAHEINHGFTSFHSNLAYRGEPGGLNEGFSDIAGKTAEFFFKETANFDIGGDVFKAENRALRYMCDPTKDGRSIDNASQMTSSTDPHYSSGVPNKAFCRAAKRLSSGDPEGTATRDGVRRAAAAFYLANAQYWTSSTKFAQGARGVIDAARALQYSDDELAALKASWIDVGVSVN